MSYAVDRVVSLFPGINRDHIADRLHYATYVNVQRRYMYFEVPKAGCTSLKILLHEIENLPPVHPLTGPLREVRRDMFIHDRSQFKMPSLLELSDSDQNTVLNDPDFFKFTFVRNPFTRLVSAWRDKARQCAPGFEYFYTSLRGSLPDKSTPLLSFREFIDFIASGDLNLCDHHWRRQVSHVFYPAIPFSFMGRLERFRQDLDLILTKIGSTSRYTQHNTSMSYGAVAYDETTAATVLRLYERDFQVLGYDEASWKLLAQSERRASEDERLELYEREIIERNVVIGRLYESRSLIQSQARAALP